MHTETLVAMLEEWEAGDETRTQDSGEAALREIAGLPQERFSPNHL